MALSREESHHGLGVLRLRAGEEVELFDGQGGLARGRLAVAGKTAVVALARLWRVAEPRLRIDVAAAIPKGARVDQMVEQLTQLGADRLIPLVTARSVVDPRAGKLQRLRQHVVEATKQCGRAYLMGIGESMGLGEVLGEGVSASGTTRLAEEGIPGALPGVLPGAGVISRAAICDRPLNKTTYPPAEPGAEEGQHPGAGVGVRLMADPGGKGMSELRARIGEARRVLVLIGPEGGWTDEEREMAVAGGCLPWALSGQVLRIETAAAAAVAILRQDEVGPAAV
ncbi:MAG: 16S rRNA (uracil(1498)-N(3))-methyltransferase [Phycisphaeraceae bacterium]|nr:16S rRNA (uracil(1498)-N(3))-methyltransferase [Phycisphaeraceae bacterium]